MEEHTQRKILSRSYPTVDSGEHSEANTGDSSEAPVDDCPCSRTETAEAPSIYKEFWRDNRAMMERRDYAKVLATISGLTAVGTLAVPLAGLTRVFERSYTGPVFSDGVALVDSEGERIEEGRLAEGEQLTVFPEPRPGIDQAPTLLVRFPTEAYGGATKLAYTTAGYAAYSKVCTHAGCMVADRDGDTLVCPCHSGRFDPLSGASVTGGPPPRPLPQLPITVSGGGELIAVGDFDGSVGAGGDE
ncbi:QcrA and Rieske domain-containing protein [Halalkalicoccus subterraneus]|uniref:QcrA and Rieske domain-containing protein n=1 Tax=Halalkalicoccus subterraneus TaxID=2675002 RepID=UPI000EFD80FC|nr:Rieske (2Fe-2S) protein [Halalkalicoccus subterraneus]